MVNNECRLWYNRAGDFLLSVWERRKKFCTAMNQSMMSVRPIPLQTARSMALSAMQLNVSHLFIY